MAYIYSLPTSASFTGKGLVGYTFGPLSQKDVELYYVEVKKGHDVFMISKKITRTYYILSGSGYFTIGGHKYNVGPGMLIEVPPKIEYCYSGRMTLIAFSKPRWFSGNDTFTKWNADVVGQDLAYRTDGGSLLTRLVRVRLFGKSPVNAFLRLNQRIWDNLPSSLAVLSAVRLCGDFSHKVARMQVRSQAFATLFLRNRPELELIRRLLERTAKGGHLRVTVLGCSTGAEAYSVAWKIRSARPDIKLTLRAVDISKQAVEFAKCGMYSIASSQLTDTQIFEAVTPSEMEELFHRNGDTVTVKSWIKEGIEWHVGDVGEPEVIDGLGPQDIVVANNFLCHMDPPSAEMCLRNIARLVSPNGYVFVSGIDLDVRTKVARDLGWVPLEELLEEVHEGDPYLRRYWPGRYAGLEPLNKKRADWRIRYAAAFQFVPRVISSLTLCNEELGGGSERSEWVPVLSGDGNSNHPMDAN
ncbi:CheR family methyltransferase [Tunturibacter psychrotolerans]|uniref:CheR family methyltransferase n=1 Tax=Tunturiibacter psychrotolerans TaxID=3069686 RepID=A0AAU7ZNH0_9BACT